MNDTAYHGPVDLDAPASESASHIVVKLMSIAAAVLAVCAIGALSFVYGA